MPALATRYAFTAQFVAGSVLLSQRAAAIEAQPLSSELERSEHRSLVVAAIMQSSAALETELSEIVVHGPGCHLGSNGIDHNAQKFLAPLEPLIDKQSGVLNRWQTLLYLLQKGPFDAGALPFQDASLLVLLRNELVHHKSQWGGALSKKALVERLMARSFQVPPWVLAGHNDFPNRILVADCAQWAAVTAANFLDAVYLLLGVKGVLDHNRNPGSVFESTLPPNVGRVTQR